MSSLACDLREDFFPHFHDFFTEIESLIMKDQQDAEVLNQSFNCISHMVYFLHRCLVKQINEVSKYEFLTFIIVTQTLHPIADPQAKAYSGIYWRVFGLHFEKASCRRTFEIDLESE